MKIVFLDSKAISVNGDLSLDDFKNFGDVTFYDRTNKEDVLDRVIDADIVFTNKVQITNDVIDKAKNLKYIGIMATGTNIIENIQYAKEHGVTITNVPGYSTCAVAELTFSLILYILKGVHIYDKKIKEGVWENCLDFTFYYNNLFEINGKTLGVIGYGSIAKAVIKIAHAFNMNVYVYTKTPKKDDEKENLSFVSFDKLLKCSDIITIHCPLTEKTNKMFKKREFDMMKKSAILINTARGAIVDEVSLAQALNENKIYAYGADVVEVEPIDKDNPLKFAKNCVLTPHIAWANLETRLRLKEILIKNLKGFLDKEPINVVK